MEHRYLSKKKNIYILEVGLTRYSTTSPSLHFFSPPFELHTFLDFLPPFSYFSRAFWVKNRARSRELQDTVQAMFRREILFPFFFDLGINKRNHKNCVRFFSPLQAQLKNRFLSKTSKKSSQYFLELAVKNQSYFHSL